MRFRKFRAKDDWKGIFYIGKVDGAKGFSVSFGKKSFMVTW